MSSGRGQGGLQLFTLGKSYPQPLPIGNELDGAVPVCAINKDCREVTSTDVPVSPAVSLALPPGMM